MLRKRSTLFGSFQRIALDPMINVDGCEVLKDRIMEGSFRTEGPRKPVFSGHKFLRFVPVTGHELFELT